MDKTLTAKLLPAALICKGFITGMADCDYEIYLREVVNASIYFKSKSDGQVYTAPPDESHGEWDCISENYSLDFKLIASETAYCGPKVDADNPKYKPIQATRIFAALRSVDLAELKSIRKSKEKQQGIETDIKALLDTLETQKHILMFFPYEFFTETDNDFSVVVSDIIEALTQDFSEVFKYRKEVAAQFDVYFTFLYEGHFILAELCENELKLVEAIKETSSPTYMKIKSYAEWG